MTDSIKASRMRRARVKETAEFIIFQSRQRKHPIEIGAHDLVPLAEFVLAALSHPPEAGKPVAWLVKWATIHTSKNASAYLSEDDARRAAKNVEAYAYASDVVVVPAYAHPPEASRLQMALVKICALYDDDDEDDPLDQIVELARAALSHPPEASSHAKTENVKLREALEQITQRANESGSTSTMALVDTIHAMHRIARAALAQQEDKP